MNAPRKEEQIMTEKTENGKVLNVLSLEDSAADFEIIREQLIDAGYQLNMTRVEKESELESSLRNHKYDIILADFRLPGFDAFVALKMCNEICPGVPFICVSGMIGEDTAIELIKRGAVDYVLKDRIGRLPFALKRALDEARQKEAHRQAEEALRESELFLKETQVIAQLGSYVMDIPSGKWVSSEILDQIFGIDAGFDKSFDGWLTIIHPDYQPIMNNYFLQEVLGTKTSFDKEYKIIRKVDKAERWVHGKGKLKFDENDQPVTMVGTIHDITEHKLALEVIKKSQLMLVSSLENLKNTLLLSGDKNYQYIYFNKTHSEGMKHAYNADIKTGMNILECITSANDRKSFKANYDRALNGGSFSDVRISGDIEIAWYESFFNPIANENNEIVGVTVLSINITDRKRAESELEKWINIFKPKAN